MEELIQKFLNGPQQLSLHLFLIMVILQVVDPGQEAIFV
jgi:hypothetical protein